ncbi:MAG: hypothetical protein PUP92_27215 [Rhizonema sp. PD38]|nr:hypothetical protein [Rhizonema sp. PD38]
MGLTDTILNLPLMVAAVLTLLWRDYVAHQKGKATDPIKYFAAPENKDAPFCSTTTKTECAR